MHVLAVDQAFLRLGDLGFQIEDGFGLVVRIGDAGIFQLRGDVSLIPGAKARHVLVGLEVVVAIRHAQPALQQVRHAARRVFQPLRHEQAEQMLGAEMGGVDRVHVRAQFAAEFGGQRFFAVDGGYRLELRLQWREAALFDRGRVHERGVVVGDLALIGSDRRLAGCDGLDQFGVALFRLLEHLQEHAGAGSVGGNHCGFAPVFVGVAVEVIAGFDAVIDTGQVDARRAARRIGGLGGCDAQAAENGRSKNPSLGRHSGYTFRKSAPR